MDELSSSNQTRGLKILFLSSDTGGGHRASAESLAKQFQLLFPGSTYDLLDIVEKDGVPPYNSLVKGYKHLSAHPSQWKLVYNVSNSRAFEMLADAHLKLMCEKAVRKSIKSYDPDVVISVHPLMTNVPVLSCSKITNELGKKLPMFTVVTDLGSAHCLWFANGVDKMFVGSEQVKQLAISRGKVPEEKIVLAGLPIRHDFAVQSENLGDRMSPEGKAYQQKVRQQLELPIIDKPTILVMGGGEGVGSLSHIVDAMYVELVSQGIDALVVVICGRNEKLQKTFAERDWKHVLNRWQAAKQRMGLTNRFLSMDVCGPQNVIPSPGCIETGSVTGSIRRMLSQGSLSLGGAYLTSLNNNGDKATTDDKRDPMEESGDASESQTEEEAVPIDVGINFDTENAGSVQVLGVGFVSNIAEYMVAADVLVSKAGPGTISEAAALSLPIMLTSFLPGQEEGNVEYVVEGGFGAYCSDSDPMAIAEEVCMWLADPTKLEQLSRSAKIKGVPYAARNIAQAIGDMTFDFLNQSPKVNSNA
jgi:UDP-N-acetylglucosamine:LPS N-acetylglucosamine transferase